jgi:hypothetical protein
MECFFNYVSKFVPHYVRDEANTPLIASRKLILRACFNEKNIANVLELYTRVYVPLAVKLENVPSVGPQIKPYCYDAFNTAFKKKNLTMKEYV